MSSSTKLLLGSLSILLLLGAAGFVYKKNNSGIMNSNPSLQTLGSQLYSKGDLDEAVKILTQASSAGRSAQEIAASNVYLGMALMKRGGDEGGSIEDVKKGAELLAEVANDSSVSPELRANAATAIASRLTFISSDKYAAIAPQLNTLITGFTSVDDAYKLLLEKSIGIKPNPFAMYSLAGGQYYIKQVTAPTTSQEQKVEIATTMIKLVADAEALPAQIYSPEVIAAGNYYRARAMTAANRVLSNYKSEDIKKAYYEAINFADATGNAQFSGVQYYGYLSRFFFANYLIEFLGKEGAAEAEVVMQRFQEIEKSAGETAKVVRGFFVAISDNPQPGFQPKKNALRVAEVSPVFKSFLESIAFKGF